MADLAVHFAHHSFSATAKISEAWLFWAAREKEAGAAMSRRARFFSNALSSLDRISCLSLAVQIGLYLNYPTTTSMTACKYWACQTVA